MYDTAYKSIEDGHVSLRAVFKKGSWTWWVQKRTCLLWTMLGAYNGEIWSSRSFDCTGDFEAVFEGAMVMLLYRVLLNS